MREGGNAERASCHWVDWVDRTEVVRCHVYRAGFLSIVVRFVDMSLEGLRNIPWRAKPVREVRDGSADAKDDRRRSDVQNMLCEGGTGQQQTFSFQSVMEV